jgi:hypothetical protein
MRGLAWPTPLLIYWLIGWLNDWLSYSFITCPDWIFVTLLLKLNFLMLWSKLNLSDAVIQTEPFWCCDPKWTFLMLWSRLKFSETMTLTELLYDRDLNLNFLTLWSQVNTSNSDMYWPFLEWYGTYWTFLILWSEINYFDAVVQSEPFWVSDLDNLFNTDQSELFLQCGGNWNIPSPA